MKIRTRLKLNTWFSLGAVILMFLSLGWSFWEADRTDRNELLVDEIEKAAFERIILRDDWLLYREDRARTQWQAKTETLRGLLESASQKFTSKEAKGLLEDAREDFTATSLLFSIIIEKHKQGESAIKKKLDFTEAESRLISQVFLRAYSLNDNLSRLHEHSRRAAIAARNKGFVLIIVFIMGGIMAMVVNSSAINKIVTKRIAELNDGVAIIGDGNLDYQIATAGNDELADLARASNEMAAKLKQSYTSVENLQKEISERKEAKKALQTSEQRYRVLFENAAEGISVVDPATGEFVFCNPALCTMFGYTAEEFRELRVTNLHPPGEFERVNAEIKAVGQGKAGVHSLASCLRKGGVLFKAEISGSTMEVEGQRLVVGFFTDVTERIRGEETLRESELRYRAIGESIDYGVWVCAPDGRNTYASDSFLKLVGLTQEQCSNFGWGDVLHPDDAERTISAWKECVRTGGKWDIEHRFRGVDGEWHTILARGVPVRNNRGEIVSWAGINLDIGDLKRAEEEIKKLNEELEQRVSERTNQLEAVNKELESFAYSVSHDLRAPLRSIDGFSHALMEDYQGKLDATGKNYLERIRKATQHMGSLIDDMLKLSKATRSEFHVETLALSKMVQEIVQTYKKNTRGRTVKAVIQKGISIQGDPDLMQIALTNLIDNAWKFTGKQKHPLIEFGTMLKEGENVLFVQDNGVGFDMAYVDKLFGAFQRLHTTDEFAGTGIGLATVQRIIHRHGGKIWAEGEVGKGATFFFTLPEG